MASNYFSDFFLSQSIAAPLPLLITWVLLEISYFAWIVWAEGDGEDLAKRPERSRPEVRRQLWSDIVLALNQHGPEAVDEWLAPVFGTGIGEVRRCDVEELLAETLFALPTREVLEDPLMRHSLNSTVVDLEIKRSQRFPSGRNQTLRPPNLQIPSPAIWRRHQPILWRFVNVILCSAADFLHSLVNFTARPAIDTRPISNPSVVVFDQASESLSETVLGDTTSSPIIVVDPQLHPMLSAALRPGSTGHRRTAATHLSQLLATGGSLHVVITSRSSLDNRAAVERYCELRSIPYHSVLRAVPTASIIENITRQIRAKSPAAQTQAVGEALPDAPTESPSGPGPFPPTSLSMMPSLENLSSIGMCLAPPLRTRQRSRSTGTVVGYRPYAQDANGWTSRQSSRSGAACKI